MLEPTAPAPTCSTRPRAGGRSGGGCGLRLGSLDSRVCRHVFHRSSSGPPRARCHACLNTLPTARATAKRRTEVVGPEWHGKEVPVVEIATQSSAQAVTSLLDAGPGPMTKDGRPSRGRPHRTLRNGLAVRTASAIASSRDLDSVSEPRGSHTDRAGTHRPSRFAAATIAGPAAGWGRAVGRRTSATSSDGHGPP